MDWDYKNHPHFAKPKGADGYLEQMSKIVFSTGLNWNVVEKKWPTIKKAFANFSLNKVAKYTDENIEKLLSNPGMIRSGSKINAIIKNAKAIQNLETEFGSFAKYFSSKKKDGLELLLKDLKKRFSYMGNSTSVMFLYAVGEESPELEKLMKKSHSK